MKGQEFGISGKKAVMNSLVGKPKESPAVGRKAPSNKKQVPSPVKKTGKEAPKRPAQPPVKPPEPKQEVPKPPPQPQPVAMEVVRPPSPPKEPVKRMITIKYSHYKDKFQAVDDYIPFVQIDEKYCISFVFKGDFVPKLKDPISKLYANKHKDGWLLEGNEYLLEVDEDEIQQSKYEKKTFKASDIVDPCACQAKKRNQRIDEITSELKGLSVEEIKAKGDRFKELIEQRDLEDILFK